MSEQQKDSIHITTKLDRAKVTKMKTIYCSLTGKPEKNTKLAEAVDGMLDYFLIQFRDLIPLKAQVPAYNLSI